MDSNNENNNSEEIDPNKGNVKIIFENEYPHYIEDCLPLQIIILDSNNNEIPIGQLTTSDNKGRGIYSKIFTFTPGTYNLVLRSADGKEEIYKNLSFTAGQLESYTYQGSNNNQTEIKIGYNIKSSYYFLPINIKLKEEGKNETVIGQLYDGDPDMYSTGDERYKIFYMKIGKNYTLTLEPSGNYEKQIFNLYTTPSGAKYIFKVEN